jgi:Mrp family chromosome partitioning ATPase
MLDLDRLPALKLSRGHLSDHRIVGVDSRDSRSRAFNLMRTRLSKVVEEAGVRLVGITSATPATGKSFISTNLALSLAQVFEGSVVLLDLDLRRGSVAAELGIPVERGVSDVLAGTAELQDVGVRVEGLPLAIFPTRAEGRPTAELLTGERFAALIAAMRALAPGTIVLVDLPPVFASDDAMLTTKELDGYILVVDSTKTRRSHVIEAMSMLEPAACLGTVLNRYHGGILEKYGYGYGAGAYDNYYDR